MHEILQFDSRLYRRVDSNISGNDSPENDGPGHPTISGRYGGFRGRLAGRTHNGNPENDGPGHPTISGRYGGFRGRLAGRTRNGNPENAIEMRAKLDRCKNVKEQVEKIEGYLSKLDYFLSAASMHSRGFEELKRSLKSIKKEADEHMTKLSKMKF